MLDTHSDHYYWDRYLIPFPIVPVLFIVVTLHCNCLLPFAQSASIHIPYKSRSSSGYTNVTCVIWLESAPNVTILEASSRGYRQVLNFQILWGRDNNKFVAYRRLNTWMKDKHHLVAIYMYLLRMMSNKECLLVLNLIGTRKRERQRIRAKKGNPKCAG